MHKSTAAISLFLLLGIFMGISGCADKRDEPPPVKDTVFGDAVGTLNKARTVEDTTLQRKTDIDAALKSQEGETP